VSPKRAGALALGALGLLVFPELGGAYGVSLATLILYLATAGQAWNLMMGFAGQLSLGHSLYVGIGAYSAGALFFHFGIGPWLGVWVAVACSMAVALLIGGLAFRFGVSGVYFALLTIAFAEFTRIAFDHIDWLGGPGGMFLEVAQRDRWDLAHFRGPPSMYYYAALALTLGTLWLCARLSRSRAGYYWRAIREDEPAAQALGIDTFRWKLLAVLVSSALSAISGVFLAFYQNNLFPEQVFHVSRSIEILLGPVIGGVGTLLGPIVGSLVLTLLSDGVSELLAALGWELPGTKQVLYGLALLGVVVFLPNGIWPALHAAWQRRSGARSG
jgi:branched-chain amino acid transport system permease protein